MPKGIKQTSNVLTIGTSVTESAPNIFTEQAVDLNLDPLNNEVFVVLAINIDSARPEGIVATNTDVRAAVTTTTQTAMVDIADPNCLATSNLSIIGTGYADTGVAFTNLALESPPATLDYIGIIATNDFFLSVQGQNNTAVKRAVCKMYGYRAKADPSMYAAMVTSELLSN